MKSFTPTYVYNSVFEIEDDFFKNENITCVLLDIDNTLVPDNAPDADERAISFIDRLRSLNLKICLISNNKKSRVDSFNKNLNIKAVCRARKPFSYKMTKAINELGEKKENVLFIGDQLLTDIWAGNNCGIRTMLVNPINKGIENSFFKLKRFIENILLGRK